MGLQNFCDAVKKVSSLHNAYSGVGFLLLVKLYVYESANMQL